MSIHHCTDGYTSYRCPGCEGVICWNCAVECTNEETGEGSIICPHCSKDLGYYPNNAKWTPE
jgi:hypothetical protein